VLADDAEPAAAEVPAEDPSHDEQPDLSERNLGLVAYQEPSPAPTDADPEGTLHPVGNVGEV
jgi:hypothetical protein